MLSLSLQNRIGCRCGVAVLVLMAAALAGCGGGAEGDGTQSKRSPLPLPQADADPFYAAPAQVPDAPGTLLKSRRIVYQPLGVPLPNLAWQLQYVTRSADGRPRTAVATVVTSLQQNLLGRPALLSYQFAYDSLGAECTPSHTATGSTRNLINLAETAEILPTLLGLGWTLIFPDYEGPDHAFGAGPLAGRATLDAIRAALRFEPLQFTTDTPVALWGYSGGGYATSWAAALQPGYAAEINLVAAAFGGAVVDPLDVVRRNEDTDSFNFLFTMILGMAREYPDLLSLEALTPRGARLVEAARDVCAGELPDAAPADGIQVSDYVAADNPYRMQGFEEVGARVSLLRSDLAPSVPVYVYHEIGDELVSIDRMDELVAKWCGAGVQLSYHRSAAGADNDGQPHSRVHNVGAANGAPAAVAYLQGRFGGVSAPVTLYGAESCN